MIILASTSPRRVQLLSEFTNDFVSVSPNSREVLLDHLSPKLQVQQLAYHKALSVEMSEDDLVISGDTVVVFDEQILGKPQDRDEALSMLVKLNGKKHVVMSAICIMSQSKTSIKTFVSEVSLKDVGFDVISDYVDKYQPLDKAGAYGIQDEYFKKNILESYSGYLSTIIGFPIEEVIKSLRKEFNYDSSI